MPRPPELPDFPASQLFLRRLAYSLVHDEARAEDLVQDTWAAWVEHRPRGVAEPKAWLARVLRNRAFNLKRADERRARRESFAGRPDPSTPETDGTLEAQAKLIEALRELEEPYRSTLVQRYYHDLAPREIAERAGAPLNTVKARLARGLEKLRAAMDQRYRGDRKAWCHWLTVLGAPPVPVPAPHGPGSSSGGPLAALGTGGSVLTASGVVAILVLAAVWRSGLLRTPERRSRATTQPAAPLIPRTVAERARTTPVETVPRASVRWPNTSLPRQSAALSSPPPAPVVEPELPGPSMPRTGFDWRQYGGGPERDHCGAREDEIHAPRVLWFVPGCLGQPTLAGDDLYSGGLGLAHVDLDTGVPKGIFLDLSGSALVLTGTPEEMVVQLGQMDPSTIQTLTSRLEELESGELLGLDVIAPAPVITSDLVLVRRTDDGSVIAFDRRLSEVWRWESGQEASAQEPTRRIPLCLTETGIVLIPFGSELVALSVSDGREVWRYPVDGTIAMTPAAARDRVFFGTDRGLFVALSASTGRVFWQKSANGFGASGPMVVGEGVFVADDSSKSWGYTAGRALLHAWDVRSGASLWEGLSSSSRPKQLSFCRDTRQLVVPAGPSVRYFDIANGKPDFRQSIMEKAPNGTAVVVGNSLVFANVDGRLDVHDLGPENSNVLGTRGSKERMENSLRWAFQPPDPAQVEDFVHTGDRIYVATTIGLFCLADDPTRAPPAAGFVLECEGDSYLPSYLDPEEK